MCASHRYVDLDNKIVLTIIVSFSELEVVDHGEFNSAWWDAHKLVKIIVIQRCGTPVCMSE